MIVSVYILSTVVAELEKRIKGLPVWVKLESPFSVVAATSYGLRAFLLLKISGSNRFYPDCLKRYIENEYYKNIRLCDRLSNLNLDTRVKQRDQDLLASCEVTGITKRLIVGEGQ